MDGFRLGILICFDGRHEDTLEVMKKAQVDVIHHPHGNTIGSLGREAEEWTRSVRFDVHGRVCGIGNQEIRRGAPMLPAVFFVVDDSDRQVRLVRIRIGTGSDRIQSWSQAAQRIDNLLWLPVDSIFLYEVNELSCLQVIGEFVAVLEDYSQIRM